MTSELLENNMNLVILKEEEAKRLIERWEKNNIIKLNKDGSYKRIG